MKKVLFVLLVSLALAGCAPNPKDVAKADVMHIEAEQQAMDATRTREQQIKLDEIAIQNAEREQEVKDAALENKKHAMEMVTYWSGIAITISLVIVILSVGASGSIAIYGSGKAVARAAMVKAQLIYLDKSTGQYPLVLEYAGKGIVSLTDPNTNTTLLLNTRNEPDRLMIQTAGAIRHVGVLASAASKSNDPTGVAMVQPLIIDAEEK
jgi:hypothetical protein